MKSHFGVHILKNVLDTCINNERFMYHGRF